MQKIYVSFLIVVAAFLGGCDKQTQVNTEKIQALSQKIIQLQENQAKELAALQSQLASLPPMLDKMDSYYYAKGHDDALFYHTNSLQLLLAVDRKIACAISGCRHRAGNRQFAGVLLSHQPDGHDVLLCRAN